MNNQNKIALVTGGTRGIGRATCVRLAKSGANVVFTYISGDENHPNVVETIQAIEAHGVQAKAIKCDVSNLDATVALFETIIETFGRIDILVNNAGITKDGLLLRMSESDFDQVINVNLKGTWNAMKVAIKYMSKQKSGRIISMSSVVGVMGNAGQVNYAASKSGVIGMTMSLAREVGKRGITVNAIAPGFIQTEMTDVLSDTIKDNLKAQIPMGKLGEVEDIANTVAFLASDEAKYITGQTIHVDGGMAM